MTRIRAFGLRLAVAAAVTYALLVGALFVRQRAILYPVPTPRDIVTKGEFQVLTVVYDGGTVPALVHAAEGRPAIVWFHGNHTQLAGTLPVGRALVARGLAFGAIEYPGYGLSTGGGPNEASLLGAARAGLAELATGGLVAPTCVGHSLGTGVAAAMAREGRCARLVLLAPYSSLPDAAQWQVPWVPAVYLVQDAFDTLGGAADVHIPTLVVHGTRDDVVPFEMGERVAAAIPGASFLARPLGHNDILDAETWDAIVAFAR